MLSSRMRKMTAPVQKAFEREGPLTITHMEDVAAKYGLPTPKFDQEGKTVFCTYDCNDNLFLG